MQIWHYKTASGKKVFEDWLSALKDVRADARIEARLERLVGGNLGDCKHVGQGVWELRIDYGPGYRVYFGMVGATRVILLCGGDKSTQGADIKKAIEYWKDYKRRSVKP